MTSIRSFTLVELLIVIGILAILTAAVVVVLNPAELLKQARDSKRLQDLTSVDQSLNVSQAIYPDISLGTASTVYVSIADTTSTCANLGLPTLPSGWSYNCVTSANLINSDGTGWIPVNFQDASLVGAIQMSALPIDPTNTTSTGLYYTYVMGGSWEITALTEAEKHDTAINDGGMFPGVLQKGSYLDATPGTRDNGLVGYWAFEEGSGSTAYDTSGGGSNGTWSGSGGRYSSSAKVGNYTSVFNGTDDYVAVSNESTFDFTDSFTFCAWVKWSVVTGSDILFQKGASYKLDIGASDRLRFTTDSILDYQSTFAPSTGTWYHVCTVFDDSYDLSLYVNGGLSYFGAGSSPPNLSGNSLSLGFRSAATYFTGFMDDTRIYNRSLSISEVEAIYNATR